MKDAFSRFVWGLCWLALLGLGSLTCTKGSIGEGSGNEPNATPDQAPKVKAFPRMWESDLSALSVPAAGAYPYARAIVHLHSVYSHDACDGKPQEDGKINAPCLMTLREALCRNKIDVAFLTEHRTWMGKGDPIEKMVLHVEGQGDAWIEEAGQKIGNILTCKDGHKVTVFPGAENALMPVALKRHPAALSGKDLESTYGANSPEALKAFQDAGAFVLIAHTEERPLSLLQSLNLHGIEIFNLHAILDPRIRPTHLKLPAEGGLAAFAPYLSNKVELPHPDLAFLGFHEALKVMLAKWDTLLQSKMIYGFGGTDAHENVIQSPLSDGERPDAYRRMMRWFSNHLRVKQKDWKSYRDALAAGQSALVFEVLGTPSAFDFYGMTASGQRVEMGASAKTPLASLHVKAQHPYHNGEQPVESNIKLIRIDDNGPSTAAEGKGTLSLKNPPPGTYRVEVSITPHHIKYLLTDATSHYMHPFPWIYSNPIRNPSN